jgi:hypothetical protein
LPAKSKQEKSPHDHTHQHDHHDHAPHQKNQNGYSGEPSLHPLLAPSGHTHSHGADSHSHGADSHDKYHDHDNTHHQVTKNDKTSQNPLSAALEEIYSFLLGALLGIDGVDETASLFGQLLPGVGAPIATATILSVATPFVWFGILGMKEEYEAGRKEFTKIMERKTEIENKIAEMTSFAQSKRLILQQKFGLKIAESSDAGLPKRDLEPDLSYYVVDYQILENKKLIAALGKKFGWNGLVAMSAMFAGMLPATAGAGLAIANKISASAALQSAAMVLELASASCFLVGQTTMTIYAASRGYQGLKVREILKKTKEIFKNNCPGLRIETRDHVIEIIDASIRFVEKHSIEYAQLTGAGQVAMMLGTFLGMTGFGLPATVPLLAIGAPLTIFAALQRISYQDKEKKFTGSKGQNSEFVTEKEAKINPIFLFTKFFKSDSADSADFENNILQELEENFDKITAQLAAIKCYSLLHHMVHSRKTGKQKIIYLENRVDYLRDGLKRTGLEKSVLGKMEKFYKKNKKEFGEILSLNKEEANFVISNRLLRVLETTPEKLGLKGFAANPVGKITGKIAGKIAGKIVDKNNLRKLITSAKNALKGLRFRIADAMAHFTLTIEARKILKSEPVVLQPAEKKEIQLFNQFQTLTEKPIAPIATEPEKRLSQIQEQNDIIDKITKKSKKFILKSKEEKPQTNETIFVYLDPRHQDSKDHEVILKRNNLTKKINVVCGLKVKALVIERAKEETNGFIARIKDGTVEKYGDHEKTIFQSFLKKENPKENLFQRQQKPSPSPSPFYAANSNPHLSSMIR